MSRALDGLASSTLKHLREQWWNEAFAAFLEETLRPKPGKRILDVGCGSGTAEASLARLRVSQVKLFGVDLMLDRVRHAVETTKGMNARVGFAVADACRLPFADASFDSTFCVAVLQHIGDLGQAIAEFVRVTRPGGRLLAVEPDNTGRYWFSSTPSGGAAFELGRRFFAGLALARGEQVERAVGPLLPGLFAEHGVEPTGVHLFPVSVTRLGPPPPAVWDARRKAIRAAIDKAPDAAIRRLGEDYLAAIDGYASDAAAAGPGFVEIQNTMLFATVGQRTD